ncbi:MAG: 50S ribosomal protein L35 [Candidatus Andersenbacteria bacterium]
MKQKTKKAAKKRFHFSSKGKALRRHIGQAHFNGRNIGEQSRDKHGARHVDSTDLDRLREVLPYQDTN